MDLLGPVPSCAGALVRSGTGVVEENNARVDRERKKKKDKREVWARLLRRWKSLVVPSRRLDSTFLNASMIILLSTIHLWKKHLNISNTLISNCSTDVYNGTFFFLILFFSFPPFNLNLRVVSRSELLDHETYNLRKISITKV